MLPSVYPWVFQVVSFPQGSSSNPIIHLLSPPYVPYAPPISFLLSSSPEYVVRSAEHKGPHYPVFSALLLPRLSYSQMIFSAYCRYFRTPSAYVTPTMWGSSFTPIQNNRQNVLKFIFLDRKTRKQKILHRVLASIPLFICTELAETCRPTFYVQNYSRLTKNNGGSGRHRYTIFSELRLAWGSLTMRTATMARGPQPA